MFSSSASSVERIEPAVLIEGAVIVFGATDDPPLTRISSVVSKLIALSTVTA